MKIVIRGGTGQLGTLLARTLSARGDDVVVLGRTVTSAARFVAWDARTLGPWAAEIDGADVVINLAGRSVNCRYTEANLAEMMSSRVESTRVVGAAIAQAVRPPRVWLQMSTATLYAHRFEAANDEVTGQIGGDEPDAPTSWKRSIDIAKAWELAIADGDAATPRTRKVALRTAMVMTPDKGGIFDVLFGLARSRLGGAIGGGRQFVSWIHGRDFTRAIELLIARDRCVVPAHRNRARLKEPARGAEATGRCGLRVRVSRLARCGSRPRRTQTRLMCRHRLEEAPASASRNNERFETPTMSRG